MASKFRRSKRSWIMPEAKVNAVSKSLRRNASSCFTTGTAAAFASVLAACAQALVAPISSSRNASEHFRRIIVWTTPHSALFPVGGEGVLVHHGAAVDVEGLAGDVARLLGGEEHRGVADVL